MSLRSAGDQPAMFDHVLNRLIEDRLLTPGAQDQGPRRIDIAHEMLIVGWPALREWVRLARELELLRRRLETKAREWVRLGRGRVGYSMRDDLPEA